MVKATLSKTKTIKVSKTELKKVHQECLTDLLDVIRKFLPIPSPKPDPVDQEYIDELLDIIKKLFPGLEIPKLPFSLPFKRSQKKTQSLKDLWDLIRELFPDLGLPEWPFPEEPEEPEPEEPEPEDPIIPLGVQAVGASIMWDKGYHGEDILIGIIDTGIRSHPDLDDKVIIRKNYTNETGEPGNEHGTHVAGTIAAHGGILGIAYEAKLADYRVLDSQGSGDYLDIARAINDAANDGCHIINMSLGGPQSTSDLEKAVRYATDKGVLIVCAAGNEGDGDNKTDEESWPAMYPQVISVGSVDYERVQNPSDFSNSNIEVDCCSHGERVLSTGPDGDYVELTGTSMACPHIVGIAALIANEKAVTGQTTDLFEALLAYAKDVYLEGRDNSTGKGFITFAESI